MRQPFNELVEGTRNEVVAQARSQVAASEAQVERLARIREEYTVRATQDGLVDAMLFKDGDRPPAQAVVALLPGCLQ